MDQNALVDISKHIHNTLERIHQIAYGELMTARLLVNIKEALPVFIIDEEIYREALKITTRFRIVTSVDFRHETHDLIMGCYFAFENKKDAMQFKLMWG